MTPMNRRSFLQTTVAGTAALGLSNSLFYRSASAQTALTGLCGHFYINTR